jgi:uncharacterized protein
LPQTPLDTAFVIALRRQARGAEHGVMSVFRQLADRTVILFLGVGVGTAMGYAFAGDIRDAISPETQVSSQAAASPQPKHLAEAAKPEPAVIECAMPFEPRLLETVTKDGKVRVGVFGDSFGDGVWAALYHQLPARDHFEVIKFSQQSTGFTRYASLNLEDHVSEQLVGQPIDIAVISFGANDTQGVMHQDKFAPLLSPAWKDEIGARIDRYIALLRRQGAVVYWVGLPVMKKPSFDADISGMNAFFAERMKRIDVPFIDTRPMSVDANGAYAAYLPEPGTQTPRLIRANDGIHMSMGGYQRLTGGLADRIRRYVDAAREHAERDGVALPQPVSASLLPPSSPPPPPKPIPAVPEPKPAHRTETAEPRLHLEEIKPPDGEGLGASVSAPEPPVKPAA